MNNENRWGVLYCPRNGYNSKQRREQVEKILKREKVDYDFVQSEDSGSVTRLIKMFLDNGYKTIVVMGGDSALNDAVNCLMGMEELKRRSVSLGLIPNGVMNDFAHFWDLDPHNLEAAVMEIIAHRVRPIDVGVVNYYNRNGEKCHRYFLNCVNIGLVASTFNTRRRSQHFFRSRMLSFIYSFFVMIFHRMDYKVKIKVNSDTIRRKVMTICVGNCSGYGLTPNAVPYNGYLDVSVVYTPKMTQLFEGIYLFVRGKFLNHKSVHPYRSKEVKVELEDKDTLVGIDGRLMRTPVGEFRISVLESQINFLM